jgi:hypothetical protein
VNVLARDPLRVRVERSGPRFSIWFAFGVLVVGLLWPAMALGWLGVLDMARDGWGLLGTLALIGFGAAALLLGARELWGWIELELGEELVVAQGIGTWWRREVAIARPVVGTLAPMVHTERDRYGEARWLELHPEYPRPPVTVGYGMSLSPGTLAEIGVLVDKWCRREPLS